MIVKFGKSYVEVLREVTDPKFHNDDSWFLYRLARTLKALGHDVVKKRAHKDGHLVDDTLHYVRERRNKWFIYDPLHATRSVAAAFDSEGIVVLARCEV